MILVTGATGHFGKATVNFLLEKGVPAKDISTLVRNEESIEEFKRKGIKTLIGDYNHYHSLVSAFKGVEKLLFVSSNDIVNRTTQHHNVVAAAQEAGVPHILYTSFQRKNETETSPLWMIAQSHILTEKWIKESGIQYSIMRNNLYMDFLPAFIGEKVTETGVIYVPAANGKVSAVLRTEMAEAAATILVSEGTNNKEYDFSNTEGLTYQEIATIISEIVKKPIDYISPSVEDYVKTMSSYGVPAEVAGLFSSFAVAQAQGELDAESSDLEQLLGRKPTSIKDFFIGLYAAKV